ncbi:HD domain-containing protein 2 [Cimex lectularius]|uniref:5'-deoxynucleotidase HDDC2 n=1 Tax=Cimex lectularius TaxID=79782 RepID=A0A8I6RA83_CIMLE|nr:HD domain-containing protein 2 [Cimex lectularius]
MSASDYLEYLGLCNKLKHLKRTGWVLRNVKDPETVASHMYRMAMMTFLLEDPNLDRVKCLEMSLVHDLAESIVGDFTPVCDITPEKKHEIEMNAMEKISNIVGKRGDHLLNLFTEYEDQTTEEAKFVKELDRLDMILQAFEYEKAENDAGRLQEFFDSTQGKFKHPEVVRLVNELNKQRAQKIKGAE